MPAAPAWNGYAMPSRFEPAAAALAAVLGAALAPVPAAAQQVRLLVQSTALAGYNYHAAPQLFAELHSGDALELVREPDNPHDVHAVRVDWRGQALGYVPRSQNAGLAAALDRGVPLAARISRLQRSR